MTGEVEQRARSLGDRHLLRARCELDDLIARLYLALLQHAEVEARPMVGDQQSRDAHRSRRSRPGARHTRLCDLEDRAADPVAVADADFVVVKAFDLVAQLPVDEVVVELSFQVAVGVALVDEDGALLATMPREVALPVALDVELAHRAPFTECL